MPKIQVKIDLFYDIQGTGEPLLLIAGFNSDSSSWSAMMPALVTLSDHPTGQSRSWQSSAPDSPTALSKWQRMPQHCSTI